MRTNVIITLIAALAASSSPAATPASEAAWTNATQLTDQQFGILRTGDLARLRDALAHGLSPNARDAAGNTPLMHAVVYGDLGSMRLLLDKGAEVNAENKAGATALMRAACDHQKLALLLDRGADVSARSAF